MIVPSPPSEVPMHEHPPVPRRDRPARAWIGRLRVGVFLALMLSPGSESAVAMQNPGIAASSQPAATSAPVSIARDQRVTRWRLVCFWGLVLLFVFMIAAGVIIRFSERFKAYLLRGGRTVTPTEDVWSMHKLPADAIEPADEEEGESPSGDEPGPRPRH